MTTKTISGTYSAGYLLSGNYSAVTVTSSGSVGGFGLLTTNANVQVNNSGHLEATNGGLGVSLLGSGEGLTNHAGGYIEGGRAIGASGAGSPGNSGGAGAYLKSYGTIRSSGNMVGGGGGAGVAGSFGGDGGLGGEGATFHAGGYLGNVYGYMSGGRGGAGGASSYSTNTRGGTGGGGGIGVDMAGYGVVANDSAGLIGGYGGQGGGGSGPGGYGGTGGAAVYLGAGGIVLVRSGFIEGGIGGRAGYGAGAAPGVGGTGGDGVDLAAGGYVVNLDLVIGGQGGFGKNGVDMSGRQLGQGGDGVFLRAGGEVQNYGLISGGVGGQGDPGTRPGNGGDGVRANGGLVLNYGTIDGGGGGYSPTFKSFCGYGVSMSGAGSITNGSASTRTAIIEGNGGLYSDGPNYNGIGVVAGAGSSVTLTNFGTISGGYNTIAGGTAVSFQSSGDTLVAEAGSVFKGAVLGGGGLLELGAGTGTLTGLDASGGVTVTGFLGSTSITAFQNFGTLEINSGGSFATTVSATIAKGKTLIDDGVLADGGTLTVAGAISGSGTLVVDGKLTLQNKSALSVATVLAEAKTAKVTIGANLAYAGLWDQTQGALTINSGRTFDLTGATDYLYGKTTTNNGDLEYAGSGHLYIQSAFANNGALIINSGAVTLENAAVVTGAGDVLIEGGTLAAASAFNQAVTFEGAGTLILDRSQSYTATVSGFSTVGANFLDLGDIGFVSPTEATFSGTAISGVLTVSDGMHTAHINLSGDYLSSTFVCAGDGHGGVVIHDPTQAATAPPSIHALVAAMATLGAGSASAITAPAEPWRVIATSLLTPRHAIT